MDSGYTQTGFVFYFKKKKTVRNLFVEFFYVYLLMVFRLRFSIVLMMKVFNE